MHHRESLAGGKWYASFDNILCEQYAQSHRASKRHRNSSVTERPVRDIRVRYVSSYHESIYYTLDIWWGREVMETWQEKWYRGSIGFRLLDVQASIRRKLFLFIENYAYEWKALRAGCATRFYLSEKRKGVVCNIADSKRLWMD